MKLDKEFKNDVRKEVKEATYVGTKVTIPAIVWVLIVVFILGAAGVVYTQTIGKAQKNAEREVFKDSVAYTEQAASFLEKSYKEYNDAESEQDKDAVMEYVVLRYPNLDTDSIDNDTLRQFYKKCLNN